MLRKTDSEIETELDGCIDLGRFYTFDNDWNFFRFSKIKSVEFRAFEKTYQSHILNHIAILPEVKEFIKAVDGKNAYKEPGPWVITVDYRARSKAKTHFIVVKASISEEDQ
jgi:hypothetical protein